MPLSGDAFKAELEADESGVLTLYEPSRAKTGAFYPLSAALKTGWCVASASPEERALLDAHGFGRGRVQ